jgi:hypothetical protein
VCSSARMDIIQDAGDVVDSNRIPDCYHENRSVVSHSRSDALPLHLSYHHSIKIKKGEEPFWGSIYALFKTEMLVLLEYLAEMSHTKKIRPSNSPASAPMFFVSKVHCHSLHLSIDY